MKELSVHIAEPCHEDWYKMTPVEKGRHCQQCDKTVVDFTAMSKHNIVEHLKSTDGSICGRFYKDQLNVNLLPARKNKWFSKYAALLFGLLPVSAYGQYLETKTEVVQEGILVKQDAGKGDLSINGSLIDAETKDVIIFGTVVLYNNNHEIIKGVETDMKGRFVLDVRKGEYIEVSHIGYESRRFNLEDLENMNGNYVLTINEIAMKDAIMVSGDIHVYEEECMKNVNLSTIEIGAYHSQTEITISGSYYIVTGELKKSSSWFLRLWKKFKKVVKVSYKNAKVNREENRLSKQESVEFYDDSPLVFKDQVAGIPIVDAPFITIAPNPSQGIFKVTLPVNIQEGTLQIINQDNQVVYSQHVNTIQHEVDISEAPQGSYIVSFIEGSRLVVSEIFIKM